MKQASRSFSNVLQCFFLNSRMSELFSFLQHKTGSSINDVPAYCTIFNSRTLCAYCFWGKIHTVQVYKMLQVHYFKKKKNPLCTIIRSCTFIKFGIFGLFSLIFWTFLPNFAKKFSSIFPFFMPILSIFLIYVFTIWLFMEISAKIILCVYSILCILGFFHPACAFISACAAIRE